MTEELIESGLSTVYRKTVQQLQLAVKKSWPAALHELTTLGSLGFLVSFYKTELVAFCRFELHNYIRIQRVKGYSVVDTAPKTNVSGL